jgi:hypothetical protein
MTRWGIFVGFCWPLFLQVKNHAFPMKFSVIICTHNPRRDYLDRTIAALMGQTLLSEQWEMLVIDNGSTEPLASYLDLRRHPQARIVREEKLGLTPARLRGIRESTGELLVFVDDDNLLAPDYLAAAERIAEEWPKLGAWGGQIIPVCDTEPPEELRDRVYGSFGRILKQETWTNVGKGMETTPWGAGMVVRRVVADHYAKLVESDPARSSLDRIGESLSSCGDVDLAWSSHTVSLGTGMFPVLKLDHLVPPQRMTLEYLLKLTEAVCFSSQLLNLVWGMPLTEVSRSEKLYRSYRNRRLSPMERAFVDARIRGEEKGLELVTRLKKA